MELQHETVCRECIIRRNPGAVMMYGGKHVPDPTPFTTLRAGDLAAFAKLGIGEDLLHAAGVERVTDAEARERYGIVAPVSEDMAGLIFPYYAPETGYRSTARLRRDHPEMDEDGKPLKKYVAAYGDRHRLYYPPGAEANYKDGSIPVVLVESEKASLSLSAWTERSGRHLLVLGMGGCWGWRNTHQERNERGVLVDVKGEVFDLTYLADREVYVLLDANVTENDKVRFAETGLIAALKKRNSRVHLCRLPQTKGVNGPDDYIAVAGDEAMAAVLDSAKVTDSRPRILLPGDDRLVSDVARELGERLRGTIYSHGNEIVFPRRGLLQPVSSAFFRTLVERHLVCQRRRKDSTEAEMTMSDDHARVILASDQFVEQLQPLERVNTCRLPVLREGGRIELLPEGYDAATHTLTRSQIEYRDNMTLDEATALLIDDLYSEFEWNDQGRSLAIALAGSLTLYAAHLLPAKTLRPCFIVTKNAEGAGGTTLLRLITAPVLGEIQMKARPATDDEMRKHLTALVRIGSLALAFDNVSGHLKSPALEAFLTSIFWGDRLLGSNTLVSGPNLATVFITGNGLTISPDMARRSLVTELHQSYERPGERTF